MSIRLLDRYMFLSKKRATSKSAEEPGGRHHRCCRPLPAADITICFILNKYFLPFWQTDSSRMHCAWPAQEADGLLTQLAKSHDEIPLQNERRAIRAFI
jgi:hypothetical protein